MPTSIPWPVSVQPTPLPIPVCDDVDDLHYTSLKYMERQLQDLRTQAGDPYHLVPLPLPNRFMMKKATITCHYANFLIH